MKNFLCSYISIERKAIPGILLNSAITAAQSFKFITGNPIRNVRSGHPARELRRKKTIINKSC
jgi:hypothetical protein